MSAAELNPADVRVEVLHTRPGGFAPVAPVGVRLIHTPTGITVEETAARSAHANRAVAWERLAKLVTAAPEAPALPTEVREALKVAREALGDILDAGYVGIPQGHIARAALARIDALGGGE